MIRVPSSNPHLKPLRDQLIYWGIKLSENTAETSPNAVILDSQASEDGFQGDPDIPTLFLGEIPRAARPDGEQPLQVALPLIRRQLQETLSRALLANPTVTTANTHDTPDGARALHVLLVEDNRVNQIVASGMLRKLGHDVELAENGERALVMLQQRAFDLVLMDIQMPVMDGFEATRQIRDTLKLESVPVIAVTANVMQGDREACMAAGMNDYITKPYSLDSLRRALSDWGMKI